MFASTRLRSTPRSPGTPMTTIWRSPVGRVDGEDDVLERVGGGPGAAVGLARGASTLAAATRVSIVGVSGVSRTSAAGALLKSMSAGTTVVTASTLAA